MSDGDDGRAEDQELEEEEDVFAELLEGGVGLEVLDGLLPEEGGGDLHVAPAELATISTPWTSYADAQNFRNAYLRLLPLLHFTYSAINPVAVKSLMKVLGMPSGDLRKPLSNLEGAALTAGLRVIQELGLDKTYGYKLKPVSAVAA